MLEARTGRWLQNHLKASEWSGGSSKNCALVRFLSKEDQMMSGVAIGLQSIRQRKVNRLLGITFHRRHAGQGASDRDMLQQPSAILSSEHIGAVRIISQHRNDVEWLRYRLLQGKRDIHSRRSPVRRKDAQIQMTAPSVVEESLLERGTVAPYELIAPVQYHLRRVGALCGQAGYIDTLPVREDRQRIRI